MSHLILTNGDSAAGLLREAGIDGHVVPWRDVLHEGPVPETATDAELRDVRAGYLADGTVRRRDDVLRDLAARDAHLDAHQDYERIELWFEHDLYDQLQLIQILSMLGARDRRQDVFLVQAPTYIGMQKPDNVLRFRELEFAVTEAMLINASEFWAAFRKPTPEALAEKAKIAPEGFPFLRQAIKRALQELPGRTDGLARTERQILYSVDRGIAKPGPLFARVLNMEEAAFLGDWSFFRILSGLCTCSCPLLEGLTEHFEPSVLQDDTRRKAFITADLALTDLGRDVLAGTVDFAEHNDVDRWLGGTHLTNDTLWRWDDDADELDHL
ncbi:MAG: DUF1835 domain-containing protein [Methyloligellaceae bacterium]